MRRNHIREHKRAHLSGLAGERSREHKGSSDHSKHYGVARHPTPPNPPTTEATKAASRAKHTRKLPHRVSLHDLMTASRGMPNLVGQFADSESHRPVSFSDVLSGRVDLLND